MKTIGSKLHNPASSGQNYLMGRSLFLLLVLMLLIPFGLPALAQAQPQSMPEQVAALKSNMATSQANLRHYQWIETTDVGLNGEVKSSQQKSCYYGADGVLQKVDVGPAPQEKQKRGLRGRIAANKKQELTAYMQSAVGLVKTYVPPDPAKLQAVKEAGNVSLQMLEPGKRVGLVFQNYEKPGDKLTMVVDPATSQPLGINVATYLDSASDVVTLDVSMGQLDDKTTYPSVSTLKVEAKNLTVRVTNSGYRKSGT